MAEIIVRANGRPISIGVSGSWGVGKSSMLKLIRGSLEGTMTAGDKEFVFVEFNAWLYQGYDDARAALLEIIADRLVEKAQARKSGSEKAKELLGRVNWLRAAGWAAGLVLTGAIGVPLNFGQAAKGSTGLMKSDAEPSPPEEIHALRRCFEEALAEIGVTLVVLIDDLDRCLPPTTISTLEAMRLFLFLENTAFVIAADDSMIKHAVRHHFEGVDDSIVTNYFDKLIQVPIRVPPLGTQEVRAYMMLLFVENSSLSQSDKEDIRSKVCNQLSQTWRGNRVDRAFMQTTHDALPQDLVSRFDTADRLAPLMTTATQIAGNPRLIKRFLNAVAIRMAVSDAQGVGVDEGVLAKMLLFERCGSPAAYTELTRAVNHGDDGKPKFLAEWEAKIMAGERVKLDKPWDDDFIREWLTVPPRLADRDLRGVLYVSREHAPLITPEDRLSSAAAELLTAILQNPGMAGELHDRLVQISRPESTIIMDRLLERALQVQEWGTPPELDACLAVAFADSSQVGRLAAFLSERPASQIKPSVVPKIGDQPWAAGVFQAWGKKNVTPPVKAAMTREGRKHGDIDI